MNDIFRGQRNLIDAASDGASSAVPLVLNIGANLLAFISLLAAINAGLSWFGGLLDYPELSFEVQFSVVIESDVVLIVSEFLIHPSPFSANLFLCILTDYPIDGN